MSCRCHAGRPARAAAAACADHRGRGSDAGDRFQIVQTAADRLMLRLEPGEARRRLATWEAAADGSASLPRPAVVVQRKDRSRRRISGTRRTEREAARGAGGEVRVVSALRRYGAMMEKQTRFNIGFAIFAVLGVLCCAKCGYDAREVEPIPYSEFQQQLKDGQVNDISIGDNVIQGTYKEPQPDGRTRVRHDARRPRARQGSRAVRRQVRRRRRKHASCATCCRGSCRPSCSSRSGCSSCARMAEQGRAGRRPHVDRQEQGQGLRRDRHQGRPSPMSPASTRRRTSCRRSSPS